MHRIEEAAEVSVARATGFSALAIVLLVAGLTPYPAMALKTGAAATLLLWAVLRLKALAAPKKPYRRTEVWLMLQPRPALPDGEAQRLIGAALQRAFERYAAVSLAVAVSLWLVSFALPDRLD